MPENLTQLIASLRSTFLRDFKTSGEWANGTWNNVEFGSNSHVRISAHLTNLPAKTSGMKEATVDAAKTGTTVSADVAKITSNGNYQEQVATREALAEAINEHERLIIQYEQLIARSEDAKLIAAATEKLPQLRHIKRLFAFILKPHYFDQRSEVDTPKAKYDLAAYLEDLERKGESLSEKNIQRLSGQILLGIEALFFLGFAHLDLKPKNILIFSDEQGRPHATIGDLDSMIRMQKDSKQFVEQDISYTKTNAAPEIIKYDNKKSNDRLPIAHRERGLPPAVLQEKDLPPAVLYAFGTLLYNNYNVKYVDKLPTCIPDDKDKVIYVARNSEDSKALDIYRKEPHTPPDIIKKGVQLDSKQQAIIAAGNHASIEAMLRRQIISNLAPANIDEKAPLARLSAKLTQYDASNRPDLAAIKKDAFFVAAETKEVIPKFWRDLENERLDFYAGDILVPSGVKMNDKSYIMPESLLQLIIKLEKLNHLLDHQSDLFNGIFLTRHRNTGNNTFLEQTIQQTLVECYPLLQTAKQQMQTATISLMSGDFNCYKVLLKIEMYLTAISLRTPLKLSTFLTIGCFIGGFFFPPLWLASSLCSLISALIISLPKLKENPKYLFPMILALIVTAVAPLWIDLSQLTYITATCFATSGMQFLKIFVDKLRAYCGERKPSISSKAFQAADIPTHAPNAIPNLIDIPVEAPSSSIAALASSPSL